MIDLKHSDEVGEAMGAGRPLVALESSVIAQGMPHPRNVEVATQVEQDVRDAGAVPATVAVIGGRLHVGLEEGELLDFGRAEGVAKVSRADLAACIAAGRTGATTVAATMIAARLAGIEVFATGGIGGVHRGWEDSLDVSADLHELAQTPVTVVAAGAKAILDLERTLEVLETLGVPVIAHGQDEFPAFWSARSPFPAPLRMDSAGEVARAHAARRDLGLPGGQLVANPVPEADQIPIEEIEPIVEDAQHEAFQHDITGKDVTPFLLQRIFEETEGRSLEANVALLRNNARLAAGIARELAEKGGRSGGG